MINMIKLLAFLNPTTELILYVIAGLLIIGTVIYSLSTVKYVKTKKKEIAEREAAKAYVADLPDADALADYAEEQRQNEIRRMGDEARFEEDRRREEAKAEETQPEVAEEPAPEVVEEVQPEVAEEPTPEVVEEVQTEVAEEPAPEVVEEVQAEVAEEPAPEVVEEVQPEVAEEPAPEVVEEAQPEVAEEPAPEVVEEVQAEVAEEPVPEVVEEVQPEVAEEPAPEVVEEAQPEVAEEPAPEVVEEVQAEVAEEPAPEVVEEETTPDSEENALEEVAVTEDGKFVIVPKTRVVAAGTELLARTMENKLRLASRELRGYYSEIKNELLSYKGVRSRLSKSADSFRKGMPTIAKITLVGKTLKVYLALNPDEFAATKYFQRNVGDKKAYAQVPMLVKVKSERACKRVKELIAIMMEKLGVPKDHKFESVNYVRALPFKRKAVLHSDNIVVAEPEVKNDDAFAHLKGSKSTRTLEQKLAEADGDIQIYYNALKNELLSHKKVRSRLSKRADTFSKGRDPIAKITLLGKTLKIYLALDPKEYPTTRFHHKDVGEKKSYAKVPMMLKVRSPLGCKKAKALIAEMMEKLGAEKNPKYEHAEYVAKKAE